MNKLLFAITICTAALASGCDSGDTFYIRPDKDEITATKEGTTSVVTVTSSIDWTFSVLPDDDGKAIDWITADKKGGKAGDEVSLTITVAANTTGERIGVVLLSGDGASARITVTQGEYVAPSPGTLSAPSETNFAYADITFSPFQGEELVHVLFYADTGVEATRGDTKDKVFEVSVAAWGTYSFIYKAGKIDGNDQFVPEPGMESDPITIEFKQPTDAAVLKIDADYISDISARLMISEIQDGVLKYRVFRNGAAGGFAIEAQIGYVEVNAPGTYTVAAILSRPDAQTEVYGPFSNSVEVTLVITPPPPIGG